MSVAQGLRGCALWHLNDTLPRPCTSLCAAAQAFRAGEFNVLVATCIGEEGLDIPEVRLHECEEENEVVEVVAANAVLPT